MTGNHGPGHQLHARPPDRSGGGPQCLPAQSSCAGTSALWPGISTTACSHVPQCPVFRAKGRFFLWYAGHPQVTSDIWQGRGPLPSMPLTLPDSWSLGAWWERLWD